jgi:hypothetical protein
LAETRFEIKTARVGTGNNSPLIITTIVHLCAPTALPVMAVLQREKRPRITVSSDQSSSEDDSGSDNSAPRHSSVRLLVAFSNPIH